MNHLILIVEDEIINQEILGAVLEEEYDIITASSGAEALKILAEKKDAISLVLLDLNLPDMHGMDIIKKIREDDSGVWPPIIVLTADHEAEVESLDLGAVDFIPKPYPRADVIQARVRRSIELSEGRFLIGQTERDSLTGLYNREYFYRYAEHFDGIHADSEMDAIVLNINHFHLINERHGREYGDEVLKRLAAKALEAVGDTGIVCRREADTFLIYCTHHGEYTDLLEKVSEGIAGDGMDEKIVRLRMGVYPKADRSVDIERRFDRAKLAADTVRSTFTKAVAIYDNTLHESAIFAEQLLIDFSKAIEQGQFTVYYQPKYDIRGEEPVLNSAEALVRWIHPEFGMISPGVFIPLLEKNGLIQQLDAFVWRTAAAQMRDWTLRFGETIPVSVNVSRMDMFEPELVEMLEKIAKDGGIRQKDFLLEVTESAYTEDAGNIVRTVEGLRNAGFFIEMDDFGSGYSSLNMLSNLPIDALKLDMQFIRSAFKNGKNTRMLEIVIEIADSLSVPVIAEGVETAEQLFTLKAMGCDIVQGYYFSKPVPPEKFDAFILEKKKQSGDAGFSTMQKKARRVSHDRFTYEAMHDSLTGLYNQSAFDLLLYDADKSHAALVLMRIRDYQASAQMDEAVRRTAELIKEMFRSTDLIFRIGEEEFAVIATRIQSDQKELLQNKVDEICIRLRKAEDGQLPLIINAGAAFGDRENAAGDIFQDADTALIRSISEEKSGCVIF